MNSIIRKIPAKYRAFILPVITVIVIVALSATVGNYLVNNIINTNSDLESLKIENAALTSKFQVLSSVDQSGLSSQVNNAVDAIPAKPSTLPALASLRSFAAQRSLDLSGFTVKDSNDLKSNARSIQIDISVTGNEENILGLLNDLKSASPLMKVSSVNLHNNESDSRATVTVLSYWGPLPTSLGKPNSPIEGLKNNEEEQLESLQGLKKPQTGTLTPSNPQGKENPFAF
jgi:hypothetical protein